MKIKHILICALMVLAGLTVWYQEPEDTTEPPTASATRPSKTAQEVRKVTSKDGSMMVSGSIQVAIDSGTTTTEPPESDPLWQEAFKSAQKQRESRSNVKK